MTLLQRNCARSVLKYKQPTWEEWYAGNLDTIRVEVSRVFLNNPAMQVLTYVQEVGDAVYYAEFNRHLQLVRVQQEHVH